MLTTAIKTPPPTIAWSRRKKLLHCLMLPPPPNHLHPEQPLSKGLHPRSPGPDQGCAATPLPLGPPLSLSCKELGTLREGGAALSAGSTGKPGPFPRSRSRIDAQPPDPCSSPNPSPPPPNTKGGRSAGIHCAPASRATHWQTRF